MLTTYHLPLATYHYSEVKITAYQLTLTFTVAEALFFEANFGPRFAAAAAEAVCLLLLPKKRSDGIISYMAKQAKAIRVPRTTQTSLRNFLSSRPCSAGDRFSWR